jgi:hypothetical protein
MKRIAAVIYLLVPDSAAVQAASLENSCRAYANRFCWDVLGTYVDTELPELVRHCRKAHGRLVCRGWNRRLPPYSRNTPPFC